MPGAFTPVPASPGAAATPRPFSKWYNVHERHSLSEFKVEGGILVCIGIVLVLHMIGARLNRSKARKWAQAHAVAIASEFALVGFEGVSPVHADKSGDELVEALSGERAGEVLKEKSLFEFATYATGRQNVAFMDAKLTLKKRFSPFTTIVESALGFFSESFAPPEDSLEAILYPFDGMEANTVPGIPGAAELKVKDSKSTFDGFVWAIVNKERMKQIRDDRYDLSITSTRDHAKLPIWLTTMTESAEITDTLLTPELIKAAEGAGELLDYFIVTDQPVEKPTTYVPRRPKPVISVSPLLTRFPAQTQRDQASEARLPQVPPTVGQQLRAPSAHLPVLPAHLGRPRAVRALPSRGHPQAQEHAGGQHQADQEGRRGGEGRGAGGGAREGQEGQA